MRRGTNINIEDPIYLLDKNRGFLRIPTTNGDWLELRNLKFKNREAFDLNYFEINLGGKVTRIQKDELLEALSFV